MTSVLTLLTVMVLAGMLGGWGGALGEKLSSPDAKIPYLKFFVHGVVAALCVPLFLSLVGNDDVAQFLVPAEKQSTDFESLFRISGFCLIASVFSAKFMESLSNRVFALEKKVQDVEVKAQAAQEATETLEAVVIEGDVLPKTETLKPIKGFEVAVLRQLASGVPARSLKGISLSIDKSEEDTLQMLEALQSEGFVSALETSRGERWKLEPAGVAALQKAT